MKLTIPKPMNSMAALLYGLAALPVHAETALCAAEQAISCTPYQACDRTLPGAINLPVLMKIDTDNSVITSVLATGEERSSQIASFTGSDDSHLIHGADESTPWVLQIERPTGRFTATIAGTSEAFVVFGECSWGLME